MNRDFDIEREFRPYLMVGEEVLWTGRPRQGIILKEGDKYAIPFSIVWLGFAVFWTLMVSAMGAPIFMRIWGIPFILVGLYIALGRFFVDARRRSRTKYAITSDRVMTLVGDASPQLESVLFGALKDMKIYQKADGSGTICLPTGKQTSRFAVSTNGFESKYEALIDMVEDVATVFELLMKLKDKQK
jgi:hypothetical protein